jgi:hypothetical protein
MPTLKSAPTWLALALALASPYAHAWKSPQQALEEFLKFELEGGRIQSPYSAEKYLISPPADEPTGKRTIALVKDHRVMSFFCHGKQCDVKVKFSFVPTKNTKSGTQPLEQHTEGDSKLVDYVVRRVNNSWLVEGTLGTPFVSEDTFKRLSQTTTPTTPTPTTPTVIPTSGRGK